MAEYKLLFILGLLHKMQNQKFSNWCVKQNWAIPHRNTNQIFFNVYFLMEFFNLVVISAFQQL